MEKIKSNSLLKFNENQLSDVRRAVGYEDVNKLKQDIKQFDEWIKRQSHFNVKDFDYEYLERLLVSNKGFIERAKQGLDRLCTCTNLMPEFLQNIDIKNEFFYLFNVANICVLPKPLNNNYRVFISTFKGIDDDIYKLIDYYRYCIVYGHYLCNNDYCLGYEAIGDIRNITAGNLAKLHPIILHKGLRLLVEVMAFRIRKMHLISGNKLFNTVLTILRQGMSAKLKKRIVLHTSIETLHEHIPKDLLPSDYGGNERSIEELHDLNFKELSSDIHIAKVKFMEKASTDESRRLVCSFNEEYSGMPGSFKTLCID